MATNTIHSDQIYLDGLANNDSAIIQSIYKKFVPKVFSLICCNPILSIVTGD